MPPGRPREFDEDVALERAMLVFWDKGYRGVGMSELLAEIGISRQSLYNCFGSKHRLYVKALERYCETRLKATIVELGEAPEPLDGVRNLVTQFCELTCGKNPKGCLLVNALVENGGEDREISTVLNHTLSLVEGGVRGALERARREGTFSRRKDTTAVAKCLVQGIIGMAVIGRSQWDLDSRQMRCMGCLALLE